MNVNVIVLHPGGWYCEGQPCKVVAHLKVVRLDEVEAVVRRVRLELKRSRERDPGNTIGLAIADDEGEQACEEILRRLGVKS